MSGRSNYLQGQQQNVEYNLHAKTSQFRRREEVLYQLLSDNIIQNETYVSISGGKDAMVVSHAANIIQPGIKMFSWMDDLEWPETVGILKKCISDLGWNIDIIFRDGLWDTILQIGESPFEHNYFYDKRLIPDSRRDVCDGYQCNIMGLRAQESKARMKNAITRGTVYDRKSTKTICPIQWWSGKDVLTYIHKHNLPLHPIYSKRTLDYDPSRIRVSWWIPFPAICRHGYVNFLKYNYPDKYTLLRRSFL